MNITVLIPNDQFWTGEYGNNNFMKKEKKFPYSIAVLSTYLQDNGFNVSVIDANAENLTIKTVQKRIAKFNPQIVIVRINLLNIDFDVQQILMLKETLNFTLVGLIYDDFAKDVIHRYPQIDIVIRREWAKSALMIAEALQKNESFTNIQGITYKTDNTITTNPPMPHLPINEQPSPDFKLMPMKKYDYYSVLTSRGCTNNCLFCHFGYYPESGCEIRDVEKIIAEIKGMLAYGNKHFEFMHYELTGNIVHTKELLKVLIKEQIKISFDCSVRASTIDEELYDLLDQAGCTMIFFGIESGNQQILDINKKNLDLHSAEKAYKLLRKRNMIIKVFFMVGLLGDTPVSIEQTFNFVTSTLQANNASFDIAIPYPDTEFFKILKNNGWIDSLNLDNIIWMQQKFYGWKPLISCYGQKPQWKIENLTLDEIIAIWQVYYGKVPKGNDLNNLKIWFKKGPFYWHLAIRQFIHNPIGNFKRIKNIFKNLKEYI